MHCQNDGRRKFASRLFRSPSPLLPLPSPFHRPYVIIITYIYHALINALSAHMIHIKLIMIFYTLVEHSPTKTFCIKYYTEKQTHALHTHTHARTHTHTHARTHTHNDCSRNWVLILIGLKMTYVSAFLCICL